LLTGKSRQVETTSTFSSVSPPKTLEYTWPIEVLIRVKGVNFPAGRDGLTEKLSDLTVEGRSLKNLLEEMDASLFPVKSPSELLH